MLSRIVLRFSLSEKKHHVILQQGTCGADERKSAWYKSEAKKVFPQHQHNKPCSHWQRNQSLFSAADLNTLERWNVRAVEKGLNSAAKNNLAGLNLAGCRQEEKMLYTSCINTLMTSEYSAVLKKTHWRFDLRKWGVRTSTHVHTHAKPWPLRTMFPLAVLDKEVGGISKWHSGIMDVRESTRLWWLELAYSSLWVAYIWKLLQRTYMHSCNLISVRFLH